jgi:hypothetical protein
MGKDMMYRGKKIGNKWKLLCFVDSVICTIASLTPSIIQNKGTIVMFVSG